MLATDAPSFLLLFLLTISVYDLNGKLLSPMFGHMEK